MRENYLKSFFKSFGIVPLVIAVLALVMGAYVAMYSNVVTESLSQIVTGAVLAVVAGFAVVGLSGLKKEKIGIIDFIRITGLIAGAIIAVIVLVKGGEHTLFLIFGIAAAVLCLVEVCIRFAKCQGGGESTFKNYFGSLAGTFNPLLILIVGVVLAILIGVFAKVNITESVSILKNFSQYKYAFVGIVIAVVLVLVLVGTDKETEVSILDFLLAVGFVASAVATIATIPAGLVASQVSFMVLIVLIVCSGCLLLRAIFYNKDKAYSNPAHKVRTYFKGVYETYDVTIAFCAALLTIFLAIFALAGQFGDSSYIINRVFKPSADSAMALAIVAVVIGVAGVILTFIFRKFKNQNPVKTDLVLVGLLFASSVVVLGCVSVILFSEADFFAETANIILLAVFGVILVYAIALQVIRIKNFEPINAVITAAPKKEEPVEEPIIEEAPAEEPVEEEKEENNDPFALTEEDEALFNEYYGTSEEEEQPEEEEAPAEEEVVEEEVVEEEQPEEEVEYVEEVAEEPAAEEVVEEAPVEEAPAEEEEAEEEEEEEDDDEADEFAEEGEDDEPAEPVEAHKEQNIVVQDFQVIDENGEPRKIKRKFITKMMFAPYETKEYYNEIKNYLTMYRAKGRQSARCESFRYKGLVAKVALGGKAVKVFLAIDPSFIEENPKYHLKDVSEKKQYAEVPVMIKVRSQRALKYFKELVDYMFANRGVKPKRNFEPSDYLPGLIPNGEAILATLGMSTYYLQDTMNVKGIPDEMPDNLETYLPMIPGEELEEEEVEAVVYLDTLCNHFNDGDEVTIDVLKSLHVVTRGNVLRIKARGTLDRKLIVYAEYFDEDALKMLMCTNCTVVKVVR